MLYRTCTLLDILLGEGDRETERGREREGEGEIGRGRERGGERGREREGERERETERQREGGREREIASDLQYRIAHLQSPGVHHLCHIEGRVLQV